MEIKYTLEQDTIIKLILKNVSTTKQFFKGRIYFFIYTTLVSILGVMASHTKLGKILTIITYIFLNIFFKLIAKCIMKIALKKTYNKKEYIKKFYEKSINIYDNLEIKDKHEVRNIEFYCIESINYYKQYLFIIINKADYYIIPKTQFKSDEECEMFIKLLEKKTGLKINLSYPNKLAYI